MHRRLALALPLLLAPSIALAQSSNDLPLAQTSNGARLEWRVRGVGVSSYALDQQGDDLGQNAYLEHRLRLSALVKSDNASLTAEADLTNGLIAGERSAEMPYVGYQRSQYGGLADPSTISVRQLWTELKTPVAVIRVGHMTSKWGLGLVANDGAGTPDWGDHYFGDIVERGLVATRPLSPLSERLAPLVLVLGGDVVYHDQTADLTKGDGAFQGVGSVVWAPQGSSNRIGVYGVRRSQVDRDGFYLRVWVLDAHAIFQRQLGNGLSLHLEGEVARIWGDTNTVRDIYQGTRTVDQMGAAAEIGAGWGPVAHRLEGVLQAGYASGDDRPEDGRITSFKFDPEYNVGLVMFEEVMAFQTANSAKMVSDPATFGRPAAGARFLPTEGAVTNARYLMPTVRFGVLAGPPGQLTARAGVLVAQADRPLDDPYQTEALNGGVRHNVLGSTTASRDLGQEVDVGLRYDFQRFEHPHMSGDLQAGRFFPGSAFVYGDGTRMAAVNRILASVTFQW